MKLAVWNMEWLNDLVTTDDRGAIVLKPEDHTVRGPRSEATGREPTVAERIALLREGLEAIDADCLVVIEGPNLTAELDVIMRAIGPGTWECHVQRSRVESSPGGKPGGSSQCIGFAVRTDRGAFADKPFTIFDSEEPESGAIYDASRPFHLDMGDDGVYEWFRYERLPLYVEVYPAEGVPFRVLGLHLKSKGIFGALEWSSWWAKADANRTRILAQCRHLREAFIDGYLEDPETRDIPLIVCGDINDGPGFDTSEMRLKSSGVETLMGSVWKPHLTLGNVVFDELGDDRKAGLNFNGISTTSFPDPIINRGRHHVWIDHILYSRNAPQGWASGGTIVEEFGESRRYWRVADHAPVTAVIDTAAAQDG